VVSHEENWYLGQNQQARFINKMIQFISMWKRKKKPAVAKSVFGEVQYHPTIE